MPLPGWFVPFIFIVPLLFWVLVLYIVWRVVRAMERSATASEAIAAHIGRLTAAQEGSKGSRGQSP